MGSATVDSVYDHDADSDEMLRLPGEESDSPGRGEIRHEMPPEPPDGLFAEPRAMGHRGAARLGAGRRAAGRKPAKNNRLLYSGVGAVALLLAGGYLIFQSELARRAEQATTVHLAGIPPMPGAPLAQLAPSASLANVRVPPLPTAVLHKKYVPLPFSAEVSEVVNLRTGPQKSGASGTAPQESVGAGEMVSQSKPSAPASTDSQSPSGIVAAEPGHSATTGRLVAEAARAASAPTSSGRTSNGTSNGTSSRTSIGYAAGTLPASAPAAFAPASPGSPSVVVTALALEAVPKSAATAAGTQGHQTVAAAKTAATTVPNPAAASIGAVTSGARSPRVVTTAMASTAVAATAEPATLAAARAGALSPAQQTQLYQLVTEVGTLERDDRIREAVLAGEVQQLTVLTTGKLADLDRRLSMLEAQTAVSGAEQEGSNMPLAARPAAARPAEASAPTFAPAAPRPSASRAASASPPSAASVPAPAIPAALPPGSPAAPVQYQVQAASPGLAMLSVIGGDGSTLEVESGDIVPGYGKVLGVVQQGDAWVVETQSGNIQ